jgi:hypothetical protein
MRCSRDCKVFGEGDVDVGLVPPLSSAERVRRADMDWEASVPFCAGDGEDGMGR